MIEAGRTVAEVARDFPQAIEAMGALGINHCCGGGLTLGEAAASAGIPLERLLEALTVARGSAA